MNLYELSREGLEIQDILIENQGELTPDLETRLDSLLANGAESVENAVMVLRMLERDAENCRDEAKRFTERARAFENNAEALKARVVFALDAAFGGKLKTSRFTLWNQNSKPTWQFELAPDMTLDDLERELPSCVRVKKEMNKIELSAMADEGQPFRAVRAWEVEGKRFLRVK